MTSAKGPWSLSSFFQSLACLLLAVELLALDLATLFCLLMVQLPGIFFKDLLAHNEWLP